MSNQLLEMKTLHLKFSKIVVQMGLLASLSRQEQFRQLYEGKRIRSNFSEIIEERNNNSFSSKCVCISRKDLMVFKKGIFRITRGNNWIYEFEIDVEEVCQYFHDDNHRTLATKIVSSKIACLIVYQKG